MTPKKLIALAAALAIGALIWAWLPPRTANDCAPDDHACLRQVVEHLISERLADPYPRFISDEVTLAGRLLATEGHIDLANQHRRLVDMGFSPDNIRAVMNRYFDHLSDPSYPFDIAEAIKNGTGDRSIDVENYLLAAYRFALPDPSKRAAALAVWQEYPEDFAEIGGHSGNISFQILSWLAQFDVDVAAQSFARLATSKHYIDGPGGWQHFFQIAAGHCREDRLAEGRLLLGGLQQYFPATNSIELYPKALLQCEGETAAVIAIEDGIASFGSWSNTVLARDPGKADFVVGRVEELSKDLREGFADWLFENGRAADISAYWTRYGPAELARRHLPDLDWLPERLQKAQASPAPESYVLGLTSEPLDRRMAFWATEEVGQFVSEDYDHPSPYRDIAEDWPSPPAVTAAKSLLQQSNGSPIFTAFVMGLERQLGCTPTEARMKALLDDISALKEPLDEARAIVELLRFTPAALVPDAPLDYDCLID